MSVKPYSFTVGEIDCTVLLDGASQLGAEGIMRRYPDGTEAEYRQAYADIGLSLDEADNSMNILVAKMGRETVLVDTGMGIQSGRGHLLERLPLAGIKPEDITLIVITHSHGDHVLGLLTEGGQAAFPNATYVISKVEMDFWQGRTGEQTEQQAIIDMMKEKGLRLIDMDEMIMPGLTAIPAPGHTPGHIALLFESGGEKLLHMADLLHSPMQFAHPEWSAFFDADTSVSVPSRYDALGRAADEDTLTMFYHLTFPGLGRASRAGDAFAWETVDAAG